MPPSNCFETGRRSQTQSSVRPCGAETANGCLVLDRRGITAERREGELERPEDFVSAPPERVRRAFALLTRTYHGGLVLDRRGITAERREGELERPEDFVSAPPERVRRAFALLTRTYHGCRPPGSNRRKRCSKPSAATSMGLRSRTSNRADRAHLPQPSAAHRRSTRIETHRRTRSDGARQLIFLCSALAAHIARPIPHRSSQFSRPAFFCRSFFWDCFRLSPASCSFAASAFSVPPLHTIGFPPIKQPLALEAAALAFGCPRKW